MRLLHYCFLILSVAALAGCSKKPLTSDELLVKLRSTGCTVETGGKIHHSLMGAQQAFWLTIDGKRISAYRFSTAEKANIKARTFQKGVSSGVWAFEFVDPGTEKKILKALE